MAWRMHRVSQMTDIHARLVAVVDEAKSASNALISATRVIGEALGAEACTIFVRQKRDGLELGASSEDFQPDTTRERIAAFIEDREYKVGVDFDFDDISLIEQLVGA